MEGVDSTPNVEEVPMNPGMNLTRTATGLAVAGLLAVGVAVAGPRPLDRGHGWHGGQKMQFLSQLDLSEDQKTQVKAIFDEEHAKMAPLAEKNMKARHALGEAIHAPTFDESAVRAAAAQAAVVESDLAVERARLASRIRGVLTPDQQKQLDALRQQSLERMQERSDQHRGAWSDDSAEEQ